MTEDEAMEALDALSDEEDDASERSQAVREAANERSNAHIENYVREYINDANAPDHAVMISGAWGIGKSHFVRQMVKRYATDDDQEQYVYVSLAGLQTLADMDAALTVAMHPFLATRLGRGVVKAIAVALRYYNVDPQVPASSIANKVGAKLYVFDDLERCEAPIPTTLGYINRFVEHAGCHVVVVANEDELLKKSEYKTIKEKLVGQSFTFQPVVTGPLAGFVAQVSSERARRILAAHTDTIHARYRQSSLDNLRVLRQAIWDFGRLADQLTAAHLSNDDLITSVLDSFMLLSFEHKAGRLSQREIAATASVAAFSAVGKDKETLATWTEIRKRYPDNSTDHRVFEGALWVDVLVHGFLDQSALRDACDASRFVAGKNVASWKRLWDAWEHGDADVAMLIEDVRGKFQRREYTVPGEVMHVMGLHLWMAAGGFTDLTTPAFIVEARRYIDDLYASGTIGGGVPIGGSESYDGLGIQMREAAEYREINTYYKAQRARFLQEQLPVDASGLLSDLRSNPRAFIEKVSYTNGGRYIYRDVPVLAAMNVDDCAAALVALNGRDQQAVFASIRERYDHGLMTGALASERDWLFRLREKLREIAASRSGFSRFRIEKMIEWSVSPRLDPPSDDEAETSGRDVPD